MEYRVTLKHFEKRIRDRSMTWKDLEEAVTDGSEFTEGLCPNGG